AAIVVAVVATLNWSATECPVVARTTVFRYKMLEKHDKGKVKKFLN
ncbi:hypothetical protein A2U01_0079699, partial [Trifolium medium]|nr:hypothetical protein [Trifolium medium]